MWFSVWMLLACGESVTFEEAPEPEVVAEPVEEEPVERAPEFEAPIDGRPEEYQANTPQPGQPWPPISVPQDQREREWEWDFKSKGPTKVLTGSISGLSEHPVPPPISP
jgi:hypothetical protein